MAANAIGGTFPVLRVLSEKGLYRADPAGAPLRYELFPNQESSAAAHAECLDVENARLAQKASRDGRQSRARGQRRAARRDSAPDGGCPCAAANVPNLRRV